MLTSSGKPVYRELHLISCWIGEYSVDTLSPSPLHADIDKSKSDMFPYLWRTMIVQHSRVSTVE